MHILMTNRDISSLLFEKEVNDRNSIKIIEFFKEHYEISNISDADYRSLQIKLDLYFVPAFFKLVKNSFSSKERFFSDNNRKWLENSFTFSFTVPKEAPISYEESSNSTKKRKIAKALETIPAVDLLDACKKKLRLSDESFSDLDHTDSSDNSENGDKTPLTNDEALAMFQDAQLTKAQYSIIRQTLLKKGIKVLPEYRHITKAKFRCCPKFDVTETSASTKLQSVLDHSVQRILEIEDVKKFVLEQGKSNLQLISKYGCDGTSGFTQYKQAFTEAKNLEGNSVFIMCMVPISLRFSQRRHADISFWQNKNPCSTRLCRPIRFIYEKESQELIKSEMDKIQEEIQNLTATKIIIDGREITVHHTLHCTMLDGKVRQVLTETISSQRCSICDALPSEMNNLKDVLKRAPKNGDYTFGLSTLHAWIKIWNGCYIYRINN